MCDLLRTCLNGQTSKANIRLVVSFIAEQKQLAVDRLAKRTKEGLVCWLCEAVSDPPMVGLLTRIPARRRVQPPPPADVVKPALDWPSIGVDEARRKQEELFNQIWDFQWT
jgi:hypothetical protein